MGCCKSLVIALYSPVRDAQSFSKMNGLRAIILCNIFLIAYVSSETNLIVNGDFESGTKPWLCNGCTGLWVHPGYYSEHAYSVESRDAVWSGPKQSLNVSNLSPDGLYNFGYSINAYYPVELKWKIKFTLSPTDIRDYFIDIFDVRVVGYWKEREPVLVNLPPEALEATEAEIYLEGDPATTSFKMDQVYLTVRENPDNWEDEANERIVKIRKSNVNITVLATSQYGDDLKSDLTLQVTQTSQPSLNERLYHEEWRTNEILRDQGTGNEDEMATFGFRGFKGDYEIKLMDGDTELAGWTMNLDMDTALICEIGGECKPETVYI